MAFSGSPQNQPRRPCPVPGCNRTRRVDHVMCVQCWATVPREIRAHVWSTYRRPGSSAHLVAIRAAIQAARAAIEKGA